MGVMNDEQKALAESIKESSNRLLEITSELLKMTQVETGKLQLNPKITKPIELIEYAIKANQVQADRFNCHIEVEYPEKISKLFVDSEKIAWVLTNLLSNAIHYTPENGRIIIGAASKIIAWRSMCKISVRALIPDIIKVYSIAISVCRERRYKEVV